MKGKTFLELLTLSTTLYAISKETNLLEKLSDLGEQGKEKINAFVKEKVVDEDGNEMEFMDRLAQRAQQAKEDLESKIGEMVETLYSKMNIVHVKRIEELEKEIQSLKAIITANDGAKKA